MNSSFDLSGTVAIVTGSSRGIGLGIARAFLEHGGSVGINGLDDVETQRSWTGLHDAHQHRVTAVTGDVSDAHFCDSFLRRVSDTLGDANVVVCNAGIDIIKPAFEYTADEWDRVLAVNLKGAFLMARAAASAWITEGRCGSIVMVSSVAGSVGIAHLAPYAASKGGMNQLVRTLAVEWAPYGVRVNAVAPGYVDNVMAGVTVHVDPESDARIRHATPLGRRATINEIAGPVLFLATPAASYITGAILPVDGGYTAK